MRAEESIKRLSAFISKNNLFAESEPVLLAVSGGADSVVMCRMFALLGFKFGIAHCNFRLRGADSDADESFVRDLASQLKVPFFSTGFETKQFSAESGISLEMAARELRYKWLEQTRKLNGFHKIATGHHRDDNVETVMLNLTKGTGVAGLHGIRPLREKIIRPMLCFSKEEILGCAKSNEWPFRQDQSNFESTFQRNILRNNVIPVLETINPDFLNTFARNIEKFRDAEIIYRKGLSVILKKMKEQRGDAWYIPLRKLRQMDAGGTVLFEILKEFGFTEMQVSQIFEGLNGESGREFLSDKFRLIRDRNFFIIVDKSTEKTVYQWIEDIHKPVRFRGSMLKFHLIMGEKIASTAPTDTVFIDYQKLQFPLLLRGWKSGDYFYPLGLNKKKKLSDFFTDMKLSVFDKENALLLLSGEKIVWVVGYRLDNRFKVTRNTQETLKIKLN